MVLDYSKWDNLELSDDSDIEVHPNVDKRSFIRAKQHQIHLERQQRRHEIETLRYERIINDGLLSRVDKLVDVFGSQAPAAADADADADVGTGKVDERVYNAIMEAVAAFEDDQPPAPPAGVHAKEQEKPTYSKMLATLVDQVKEELDKEPQRETAAAADRAASYRAKLDEHRGKIQDLQQQLDKRLAELEQIEARKITSDGLHTGFDSSFVAKASDAKRPAKKAAGESAAKPAESVEVLNPSALKMDDLSVAAGAGGADKAKKGKAAGKDDDEEDALVEASALGKQFAQIKDGDYKECLRFIMENDEIVSQREEDGLLAEAFDAQLAGNEVYARHCVHQALLLQYCRTLGKNGVEMFFKKVVSQKGHRGREVFLNDVNTMYAKIRERTKELKAMRDKNGGNSEGVEQIQLQPVDPGTTINIIVPPEHSDDEDERKAHTVFESFSPALQKALTSGSLDAVNEVLATMSVEEAEDVVAKLGGSGMLSVEQEIIDATTEEGQHRLKEIEEQARRERSEQVEGEEEEEEGEDEEDEEEGEELVEAIEEEKAPGGNVDKPGKTENPA